MGVSSLTTDRIRDHATRLGLTHLTDVITQLVERATGDHVVAHDHHLPLDAALAGGPVGGQHIDDEPVVLGERRRFGVQGDRDPGRDVPLDHGFGAVIDDGARHAPEVGKRPAVAVPERGQVHAGGEAGERIT